MSVTSIILIYCLLGCNTTLQSNTKTDSISVDIDREGKLSKVDLFIQRIEKQFKTDEINDLALEKANEHFKKQSESFVKDSLGLSDVLMTVQSVKKEKGKDFIVHLENVKSYYRKGTFPNINTDIFLAADSAVANNLKQSDYKVYCFENYTKALPLRYDALRVLSNDRIYTDHAEIEKDFSDWNSNFGNYILESHSLKKYNP